MASMVNHPLASRRHMVILTINKIHGEFRSSCTCLQLLYGLHTTPPIDSRVYAGRV